MSNIPTLRTEKLKQRITLFLLLVSYVPFLVLANTPDWANVDSVISWAASQTGYAAAVLLLWQFALGTRAINGFLFKDQVWALKIHKRLGIYGIALVLAHPFLIAYSYSEDLLYLFYGSLETDFDRHVAMGRMAFLLFLVVWVTSAILRSNIGYRPWRYIHYATYVILPLVLLHAPGVGSFYVGDNAFRVAWQVMTALFVIFLALRAAHMFLLRQAPYRVIKKTEAAKDVFLYQLEPVGRRKLSPAPGQFVYTRRGFISEEHPFSVANYAASSGRISIAAKVFGKYTRKLSQVTEGSIVYLDGPYGVFTRELEVDPNQPTTCIAGGIGITPFIRHALSKNNNHITVFNANRTEETVVIRSLLQRALGDRYIDVFSDVEVAGSEHGRIDAELIRKHLGDAFEKQQFFICGPPPMMQAVKKSLRAAGIPKSRIHTEEFGF